MSLREAPPRQGIGSSIQAWTSYAQGLGVEVTPADGRNDIIAKVDAAHPLADTQVLLDDPEATPITAPADPGVVHTDLTRLADPTPVHEPTQVQEASASRIKEGEQRIYRSPYPTLVVQAGPLRAADSNGPQVPAKHLGQGRPPITFTPLLLELLTPSPERPPFLGGKVFVARGEYVTADPVEIELLERVPEAVRVA